MNIHIEGIEEGEWRDLTDEELYTLLSQLKESAT